MKCQNLFVEKIEKNVISLSSAELAQRMVKVNALHAGSKNILKYVSYFYWIIGFDISYKLSICMKCQIISFRKNKKKYHIFIVC